MNDTTMEDKVLVGVDIGGTSKNIVKAVDAARRVGMKVIHIVIEALEKELKDLI